MIDFTTDAQGKSLNDPPIYPGDHDVLVAEMLMAQAFLKVCDCDTPCSCFKFESLKGNVEGFEIKASGQTFHVAAVNKKLWEALQ